MGVRWACVKGEPQQKGGNKLKDNYIGENLKILRKRKNLTQTALSKALGVPITTYNAWEQGVNIPRDEKKKAIADFYGLSVGYIFFKPITH